MSRVDPPPSPLGTLSADVRRQLLAAHARKAKTLGIAASTFFAALVVITRHVPNASLALGFAWGLFLLLLLRGHRTLARALRSES